MEKQFNVGDYINIDNYSGVVSQLSLRYTKIEDYNGDVHIISNSTISRVTNHSINPIRFIVLTSIYNNKKQEEVIGTLNLICDEIKSENSNITGNIFVTVNENMSNYTVYKIMGFAKNLKNIEVQNQLNVKIKTAFESMYIKE